MLLVIIGHIVLGSVHENVLRYTIYAFHMPLFIGLSGYLVNADKLRSSAFISLFARYWWRIILPFMLAFLFFTGVLVIHAMDEGRITQNLLLSYFVTPYYHLWFLPTLVIWVFAFWIALKLKVAESVLLVLFLALTLVWATFSTSDLWPAMSVLLSKKATYFFSFFLFGAWLKTPSSRKLMQLVSAFRVLPAALVMLCAVIYLMDIGANKEPLKGAAWLIMNLSLIAICVAWFTSAKTSKSKKYGSGKTALAAMGRISLPIYLWHMVPMFLLKGFDVHQSHTIVYYAASVAGVAVIVGLLLKLENKSTVLNKLIYGT